MMMDGTYEPPEELDEYNKKLIKRFMKNHKAKEHDPLYTDEWRYFWKGATERTSCGCDILYFGTWIAGSFSKTITELDDLFTDTPLQTG
jgi:hypothetical protein